MAPFKRTIELVLKLVPFTVKTNATSPAVFTVGEMLLSVGTGFSTERFNAPELPPPGSGLKTVTGKSPAAATSADEIDAVNCVELTSDVGRGVPPNCTTELALKFVPLTVKMNEAAPTAFVEGAMVDTLGTGLLTGRLMTFEVPPPGVGFTTVIAGVPTVATSAAVMEAVN